METTNLLIEACANGIIISVRKNRNAQEVARELLNGNYEAQKDPSIFVFQRAEEAIEFLVRAFKTMEAERLAA